MTEKEKELLNALKIIKRTCEEQACCEDCPCYYGSCVIHKEFPNKWNFVKEQPTWRAFDC